MDKILVMVRTSTEVQDITDQHNEMETFVLGKGWKKNQIIWVEEQGASAIKVDETYRAMIDNVKAQVETNPDIKCFAVWSLNRLARTEEVWIEVKSFFVAHQVQVIVKNPELKLLTDDGKVDAGMELAFALLSVLSKQEMQEKKARFKRAKTAMMRRGQSIGGNTRKFGYKIGEGKYFEEDEKEGAIVRQVFQLYSSGSYSVYTLSQEMEQRGVKISDNHISRILRSVAYIGEEVTENGLHYPPIITKELWDKCKEIRESNKINMKRGERLLLGAKLVKCYKCGATCTSNSKHYVCCRHAHKGECDNGFAIRQYVVDDLLWRVASTQHLDYLTNLNENKIEEYNQQLEVLEEKIAAGEVKMKSFEEKKDRIVDSYIQGLINLKSRDSRLSKLQDEVRVHQDYLNSLQEKKAGIIGLLAEGNPDSVEAFIAALDTMEVGNMYEVVHKHISSLTGQPISYGHRDPRTHKPNAVLIKITTKLGSEHKFMYFPKFYEKHNLYVWNGRRWVGDEVTPLSNII